MVSGRTSQDDAVQARGGVAPGKKHSPRFWNVVFPNGAPGPAAFVSWIVAATHEPNPALSGQRDKQTREGHRTVRGGTGDSCGGVTPAVPAPARPRCAPRAPPSDPAVSEALLDAQPVRAPHPLVPAGDPAPPRSGHRAGPASPRSSGSSRGIRKASEVTRACERPGRRRGAAPRGVALGKTCPRARGLQEPWGILFASGGHSGCVRVTQLQALVRRSSVAPLLRRVRLRRRGEAKGKN
ncbi:atherin-like [Mustela erminea]|uniref:atherin-like n=1 Tax=Mustela erminea TaxID=36723 RepID=UPI001386D28E|nr:atherin-like [Mustela erminea]